MTASWRGERRTAAAIRAPSGVAVTSPAPRIVVLGAGMAGLEAVFVLERRLSARVDLRVICDGDDFVLRPNLVYLPFGADLDASRLFLDEPLARAGLERDYERVEGVDPDVGCVHLVGGRRVAYEHLVIATGAASWPQAVPGLREHAVTVWEPASFSTLRERFMHLRGRAREGAVQRVLFVVPTHNRCALPLYELALMLDTWLHREDAREQVEIAFVTHEASFAEAAGPHMHDVIAGQFAERRIDAHAAERLVEVRAHEASFSERGDERFDLLVAAPPQRAAVRYAGLPVDEHGFVRVEPATRQVIGHPEIYAPGDAGDFPLKDSFLALLQADAAARHIAAAVTRRRFEHPFEATSMQIVDMLDTAAFAQLTLETTGDPDHPVRLRPGAADEYKVGVSRRWRAARRMFCSHVLMQFAAGEPFQAGPGWRFIDRGVHTLAGMLAD
jgi:sulfide:quinone oxidoreductase